MADRQVQSMTLRTQENQQTHRTVETPQTHRTAVVIESENFQSSGLEVVKEHHELHIWARPELQTPWLDLGARAYGIAQIHEDLLLYDPKGQALGTYARYGVGLSELPQNLQGRIRKLATTEPELIAALAKKLQDS